MQECVDEVVSGSGHRKRQERGNVGPRKYREVAENKQSEWKITHYFQICMQNSQFVLSNEGIGT